MKIQVEKVIDRKQFGQTLKNIFSAANDLLSKNRFEASDIAKINLIKNLSASVNAAATMVQQETIQLKLMVLTGSMERKALNE
jgi:hypothetical protein